MRGRLTDRLIAAAYRFRLRQKMAEAPAVARAHHIGNPWHAVSITPGYMGHCPQVAKLSGKRLLSGEAPALPLPECSMKSQCSCRFRHHTDRRSDLRRSRDQGFPNHHYFGPERREKSRGRRSTDL